MTKEERNLIINSSICDEKKELKEILSLYNKSIKINDLFKIRSKDKQVYDLIRIKDAVKEMKDNSSLEWIPKQYKGKINKPCELCGNTQSEHKTLILNRLNGNTLLVGTRCIKKFSKMNKILYGMPISRIENIAKQNPEKLDRIIYFNKICHEGENIFSIWQNKYNEFDISFPSEYDKKFKNILKNGRHIYNLYINGRINKNEIENFKNWIGEFNYFYNKCEKFYNDNKNDKYICSKQIEKFLLNKELKITVEHIKRNGKITKDIAKYVYHPDFINRFEENIRKVFSKYEITLIEINNEYIKLSYKYKGFVSTFLRISLKKFTNNFSNIFYDDNTENFTKIEIFNSLSIYNDYYNIDNFIGILNFILEKTNYNFYVNENLYEKQEIELWRNNTKEYNIVKLNDILNTYLYVFYLDVQKSKLKIVNNINMIDNWINESNKEKYDVGNIAEKWTAN